MISVLLPKARDPSPAVASTILKAIGELATVGGEDMIPYIDKLMPIIIEALQDQSSSSKREAALRTLGQLASNSGYVIKPYLDYPHLLEILQNIIRGEPQRGPLRQETIKLMGILVLLTLIGTSKWKNDHRNATSARVESNDGYLPYDDGSYTIEQGVFPDCCDQCIAQHLEGSVSRSTSCSCYRGHHEHFQNLGARMRLIFGQDYPAFLGVIRSSPSNRLESYFNQFAFLVTIVRQHIRNFLPDIVAVLQEYWNVSPTLQANILQLVEAISRSLEGEFKIYLAGLFHSC